MALLPPSIEQYLSKEHPVRVVDLFVEHLDLRSLGFERVATEATGRPPYRPADLLKLYLYGYLNRVRSSRLLERECQRNLEVIWLLGELRPDFKTIANFRKDNGQALRGVCGAFVRFCQKANLVGGEVVALDGTKVRAATSQQRGGLTKAKVQRSLEAMDAKIERYLVELDQNDETETEAETSVSTAEVLKSLREHRQELQAYAEQMIATGKNQIVPAEPEAALMGHAPTVVGYNVQTAVDARYKLIVHHDVVSDANDRQQLYPMAKATKEALQSESLHVLADSGYHNAEQTAQCEQEQIEASVPAQKTSNQFSDFFPKEMFEYDAESDTVRCPAGAVMTPRHSKNRARRRRYVTAACARCELRPQCTSGRRRQISRSAHQDAAERADRRARDTNAARQRSGLAEHPFAWLKRALGGRFLSRGIGNVTGEIALAVTAFNLLRAINILGVAQLLKLIES